MSKAEAPEEPNATFLHRENSPTAATLGDERYKPTKAQTYRVAMVNGSAIFHVDVEAMTGDDAANAALGKHPGCKVAHVAPAPAEAKAA